MLLRSALLPASLLCRFMRPCAVAASSPASTNFLLNWAPKPMSSEQPPHSQEPRGLRCRMALSQPHSLSSPLLHARVMLYATPAADTPYTYAFSRLMTLRTPPKTDGMLVKVVQFHRLALN
uniref:Putative secreted protein n=1 Tax=Ixodes ricinus TaxID=34613 RepID=A0A6B0UNT9_IXORI